MQTSAQLRNKIAFVNFILKKIKNWNVNVEWADLS